MQNHRLLVLILVVLAAAGLTFGFFTLNDSGADDSVVVFTDKDIEAVESGEETPDAVQAEGSGRSERREVQTPVGETLVAEAEPRRDIVVRGKVVDGVRAPLAQAQVFLEIERGFGPMRRGGGGGGGGGPANARQQVRRPVITGSDGRFEFRGQAFANANLTLVVTHQGHAPGLVEREFPEGKNEFDLGEISLGRGGTLLGVIVDPQGNAVPGATAELQPGGGFGGGPGGFRMMGGRNRELFVPKVQVDANGTFRVANVMPGEWRVEAAAPRMQEETSPTVVVSEGVEEQMEPIRLQPAVVVTGMVVASDGKGVEGAEVFLSARQRMQRSYRAVTDAKGEFTIDHVAPEPLALRVTAKNYVTHVQGDVQPATGAPLIVRLQDGLRLTGTVRDANSGQPVDRYGVRIRRTGGLPGQNREGENLQAMVERLRDEARRGNFEGRNREEMMRELERAAGDMREVMQRAEAQMRAPRGVEGAGRGGEGGGRGGRGGRGPGGGFDVGQLFGGLAQKLPGDTGDAIQHHEGTFSFTGLDEGVYVVDIGSPNHQKVRSEQVTLRAGGTAPHLDVALPRGFHVEGTVLSSASGAPLAKARIELVMLPDAQPQPQAQPGGGGEMRGMMRQMFQGMGPGGVPVHTVTTGADGKFMFRHAPPGRYQFVATAPGHARKTSDAFEVGQDLQDMVLRLGALATLEGRVTGIPRGRENDARVVVFGGFGNMKNAAVDAEGNYRVTDLQPGSYLVRAFLGEMQTFLRLEMGSMMRGGMNPGGMRMDVTLQEAESKRHDVTVTLHPVGTVVGIVTKNADPARGFRVSLTPETGTANEAGGGRDGGGPGRGGRGMFGGGVAPATVDGNGQFRIPDVPEGSYVLRVQSGQGGMGGNEVHRETLYVRAEAETRVSVGILMGSLRGRVKPGEGETAASLSGQITLYPGLDKAPEERGRGRGGPGGPRGFNIPVRGGAFQTPEVPAGEYLMVLGLRGREDVQRRISVVAGGPLDIEVEAGKRRQNQPQPNNQGQGQNQPGGNRQGGQPGNGR
ncbi:MAG: carboxypeptidase regulatory-like domain-containing protein [Planctomycetes bacterium]|nr:carboxypeptidase regulatory-like domain-containing protein [Planctomycetota bacterium]